MRGIALAFALLVAGASCGTAKPADATIHVTLHDFAFVGVPAAIDGHRVHVTARNTGPSDHELEILDADGEAVDEIEALHPNQRGSVDVELAPGTYTIQCILKTADGRSHRDLGMVTELRVQ